MGQARKILKSEYHAYRHSILHVQEALIMFEKSMEGLIRGIRSHKGHEREYIQSSLKECRVEIRSQDMDVKATALLKLVYLEMFGYDMSWASFHVLEVMSSSKDHQKRVGYLGAIQSLRPDTDVLMLATNLLKKDLTSSSPMTIQLPLVALPHVITPQLALSLMPDLLPRLSHSRAAIRKKTIVTLYRLALVYPETLRPAWPKIKERLMDENEDPSVTAAIVNVVCELGWRRPQDFLPLAPRLFELLVDGGNNWMAIKIIKLFATLTPNEPRLVRKLLPPLTTIIRTTAATSLLYECIDGLIQGGILGSTEGTSEGEEIAALCVDKLQGMIVPDGDPNLKYVALMAFKKIVASHPALGLIHQDVILDCVDDPDISIRFQAIELVVDMVTIDNLQSVVERLVRQLRSSFARAELEASSDHEGLPSEAEMQEGSEEDGRSQKLGTANKTTEKVEPLPDEYRVSVIRHILQMCSADRYSRVLDFDWYIRILVELAQRSPSVVTSGAFQAKSIDTSEDEDSDISVKIGIELRNVAVRVKSVRPQATRAAESFLLGGKSEQIFPSGSRGSGVLKPSVWIAGEYANLLSQAHNTLSSLLNSPTMTLPDGTLSSYVQAVHKIFAFLVISDSNPWTSERRTTTSLLMARIINFLEPLATHPDLEVQECSVEFLELMRLGFEAVAGQGTDADLNDNAPLLLTQAIPSLFNGLELNPVAPDAQSKVPLPNDIDLDLPISSKLMDLLQNAESDDELDPESDDFRRFYYHKSTSRPDTAPTIQTSPDSNEEPANDSHEDSSYQNANVARRKIERQERHKDDPFYIANSKSDSGASTPFHNIIGSSNQHELDIESIPIMELKLNSETESSFNITQPEGKPIRQKPRKKVEIAGDEDIVAPEAPLGLKSSLNDAAKVRKDKKSLLQIDSSGLGAFSLEGGDGSSVPEMLDEEEMAKAIKEVERLRLEMQRASERIEAKGLPPGGTLVKKKKKKRVAAVAGEENNPSSTAPDPQEKKLELERDVVKPKKKKVKKVKKAAVPTLEGDVASGPTQSSEF